MPAIIYESLRLGYTTDAKHKLLHVKQMRKKSQDSLDDVSIRSFRTEDEYDRFFCDKLRRAIRDDFDSFDAGAPTYLAHILKTVSIKGPKGINVDVFSVEDFRNFLKGMKSWNLRLAILDIYIQIIKPDLRKTFVLDSYKKHIGDVLGDYFESPSLSDMERESIIQKLIGVYKIKTNEEEYQEHTSRLDDRYFVIRRSQSNKYLFCYEFSAIGKGTVSGSTKENFKLLTGVCIPAPNTSIILMRDFRYRNRHIGKIVTVALDAGSEGVTHRSEVIKKINDTTFDGRFVHIRIVSACSSDEPGYWAGAYRDIYEFDFVPKLHKYWINYAGVRVIDLWELRRINEAIDSFGDVF